MLLLMPVKTGILLDFACFGSQSETREELPKCHPNKCPSKAQVHKPRKLKSQMLLRYNYSKPLLQSVSRMILK